MRFRSPSGDYPSVLITTDALATLSRHRQKHWYSAEAGGQAFGRVKGESYLIEEVTIPRKADLRSRFSFRPDRRAEQKEIDERIGRGLHYLGDWHSHPEGKPEASARDLGTIAEIASQSVHNSAGFVLIIVGTEYFPKGLWVSFHSREGICERLHYVPEGKTTNLIA